MNIMDSILTEGAALCMKFMAAVENLVTVLTVIHCLTILMLIFDGRGGALNWRIPGLLITISFLLNIYEVILMQTKIIQAADGWNKTI